jgi:hypothetical protein
MKQRMRTFLFVPLFTVFFFVGCGHELDGSTSANSQVGNVNGNIPKIISSDLDNISATAIVTVDQPVAFAGFSGIDKANNCWCYWSISHCGSTPAPPPTCETAGTSFTFPNGTMRCLPLDGTGSCTPSGPLTPDGITWNPIYDTNGKFQCWSLNNLIPDNC